jgi:hypothetical protein
MLKLYIALGESKKTYSVGIISTWQVIITNGMASQSLSNTWPVGQANVRLNPTGGANDAALSMNPKKLKIRSKVCFSVKRIKMNLIIKIISKNSLSNTLL